LTADRHIGIVGGTLTLLLLLPLGAAVAASSGYQRWWFEARGWQILADTAVFSAVAAWVGVVGGYLVGRAGVFWAVLACIPLAVPSSLLGSAWIVALGRNGPLGGWVSVYDWPVAAVAVGLRYLGIAALIFAMQRTGSGPAGKLYDVRHAWWWLGLRPALGPAAAAFAALFILCGADHILPSMFLVHTYGTQVLIQYNALQDLPGAAALATPMLLPAVAAVALVMFVVGPHRAAERAEPDKVSAWPAALTVALAVGVPVAAVVWGTGSWSALAQSFEQMWPETVRTGVLIAVSAPACTAVGGLLAGCWLHRHRQGRWSPVPLLLINLAAPPSMLALGLIDLSARWPVRLLRDGDGLLIASYAARFVPVLVLVLFIAGLRRPPLPVTAARLFGVSGWNRFSRIHWPARRGEFGAAVVLCGLLIATELEASLLLAPAGTSTVGVRLYTLIHTAPDRQVSAAAAGVLLMLLPWIALAGIMTWRRRA
jgi:iron(III) transport system permease protein